MPPFGRGKVCLTVDVNRYEKITWGISRGRVCAADTVGVPEKTRAELARQGASGNRCGKFGPRTGSTVPDAHTPFE